MTTRSWFKVHSWIGVIAGLILFVVCWSGTMATVSREVDWLLNPAMRVQPAESRVSWGEIERSVEAALPNATVTSFSAAPNAYSAVEVGVDLPEQDSVRVHVNPYTGEVQGTSSYFNVQRFFRSFHMNLFSGKPGYYIVFGLSLFLLVSIIAPLIFYKRWWRRFFVLKTGRTRRVFWSDVHKLVGLWSLWFALVIAVTGVWYLAEGLRGDVGDGKFSWAAPGDYGVRHIPSLPAEAKSVGLPLDVLVARAAAHRPDLKISTLRWDKGLFYVDGQSEHWLVRDRANKLYLDPRDGSVVFSQRASDQPAYWRWSDTADPLHFGDFGGLASKLVWFVFGIGLTGLSLTGAWLHAQRLAQDRSGRRRARWPGTGAAMLATAVVLLASAKGGWDEIRAYGPAIEGVQHWPDVSWSVILFIGCWIAVTLAALAWWTSMLWRPASTSIMPLKRDLPDHLQARAAE